MPRMTHREMILVAIQSAAGTPASPSGSDAILIGDPSWSHEGARMNERSRVRYPSKGSLPYVFGGTLLQFTFNVELKGSGTVDVPPEYGPIIRACGMAETISAGTSVSYKPASLSQEYLTLDYWEEGERRRLTDGIATMEIAQSTGEIPTISFTITGRESGPVADTAPTPSFDDTTAVAFIGADVSIGGFSPVINSMELSLNNEMSTRPSANSSDGFAQPVISSRDPSGTINPEAVPITDADWIADWKAGTLREIRTGVIGSSAGNRYEIIVPKARLREISAGDRDGVRTREITFGAAEDAGDDELELVFT